MRTILILAAASAAACTAALRLPPVPPPSCDGDVVVERTAYLMGTLLRLELAARDRACGAAASEAVLVEVGRLERVLSDWRADSEVGRLNASPVGVAWPLSRELWSLLEEARAWAARTGGAFDPGVGGLVQLWGLRGAGRVPPAPELQAALAGSGVARLRLNPASRSAVRPDSLWSLDPGGFGKGAALRSAGAVLEAHGVRSAVLDFGGQLLVLGAAREIAVAHPAVRQRAMPQRLRVGGASVSTTSSSERHVTVAGVRLSHVLDPRSGRPVPAWGSVSVVAADPLVADVVSTALFVLGPAGALAWAAAHPELGVLVQEVVDGEVIVRCSSGLLAHTRPHECRETTQ